VKCTEINFQIKTVGFAHTHFFFEKKKQKTLTFDLAAQNSNPNRTYVRFNIKVFANFFQKVAGFGTESQGLIEN